MHTSSLGFVVKSEAFLLSFKWKQHEKKPVKTGFQMLVVVVSFTQAWAGCDLDGLDWKWRANALSLKAQQNPDLP